MTRLALAGRHSAANRAVTGRSLKTVQEILEKDLSRDARFAEAAILKPEEPEKRSEMQTCCKLKRFVLPANELGHCFRWWAHTGSNRGPAD
jgi:hypothetical protein